MPVKVKCADPEHARLLEQYDKDILIGHKPNISRVVGGDKAGVFLHQALFRFRANKFRPFFKLNGPCNHLLYREGDSWQEEVWMGKEELMAARSKVATKITKDMTAEDFFAVKDAEFANGLMTNAQFLIAYWTDRHGVTWYHFNWPLFLDMLTHLYPEPDGLPSPGDSPEEAIQKIGNPPSGNRIFRHPRSDNTTFPLSEVTAEVTSISKAGAAPMAQEEGESFRSWFFRSWEAAKNWKEQSGVIGFFFRLLLAREPDYKRIGVIFPAERRKNPKHVYESLMEISKWEIVGDPHNLLQSVADQVYSGKKVCPVQPPANSLTTDMSTII